MQSKTIWYSMLDKADVYEYKSICFISKLLLFFGFKLRWIGCHCLSTMHTTLGVRETEFSTLMNGLTMCVSPLVYYNLTGNCLYVKQLNLCLYRNINPTILCSCLFLRVVEDNNTHLAYILCTLVLTSFNFVHFAMHFVNN